MATKTPNIPVAVFIYHMYTEIGSKEIRMLLGCGNSKVDTEKKRIKEEMDKDKIHTVFKANVDTATAFKVWGWDIKDLKKKYEELKKLGFVDEALAHKATEIMQGVMRSIRK